MLFGGFRPGQTVLSNLVVISCGNWEAAVYCSVAADADGVPTHAVARAEAPRTPHRRVSLWLSAGCSQDGVREFCTGLTER